VAAFAEQADALAQGGVDCIWIETMMALEEAQAAIEGVKQVTDLPIMCSLSFGPTGRTMMGVTPEQAITTLWPLGLAACGGNCGQGPEHMIKTVARMAAALPEAVLIAKPNAGLPRLVDDRQIYDMPPPIMAEHVMACVEAGARIVGSCCGGSPDLIRAIAALAQERGVA
jgi:5-methyltetrahydrofolate--homocysteine methyltransferase